MAANRSNHYPDYRMVGSYWYVQLAQPSASLSLSLSDTHSSLEPVTGAHTVWSISQLSRTNAGTVFLEETGKWVVSFYSAALVTNLIATGYDPFTYCRLGSTLLTLLFRHPRIETLVGSPKLIGDTND